MKTLSLKDALLQVSAMLSYYAGGINGAPTRFVFIKTNKEDQFYTLISIGVAPLAEYALINVSGSQVMITHCDEHGTYASGGLPLKFLLEQNMTQEFITGMCNMIINHRTMYPSLSAAAEAYYKNYEKRIENERKRLYEEENRKLQEKEKKRLELVNIDNEIDVLMKKRLVISEGEKIIPYAPMVFTSNANGNVFRPILKF